jgi:putative SOS response-associated peptidase YedK
VVMRTFNEGKEISPSKIEQRTIDPGDGVPRGFAFLWHRYELQPAPLLACVLVTVPASKLIEPVTDRMPAILEPEDWSKWLGEEDAHPADVKDVLKTMEGVDWNIAPEVKAPRKAKAKAPPPTDEDGPSFV